MWHRHKVTHMLLENGADRLARCGIGTNLQFIKNVIAAKYNKTKCNKLRYACIIEDTHQIVNSFYTVEEILAVGETINYALDIFCSSHLTQLLL